VAYRVPTYPRDHWMGVLDLRSGYSAGGGYLSSPYVLRYPASMRCRYPYAVVLIWLATKKTKRQIWSKFDLVRRRRNKTPSKLVGFDLSRD
jgi:hypothetical protein